MTSKLNNKYLFSLFFSGNQNLSFFFFKGWGVEKTIETLIRAIYLGDKEQLNSTLPI